MTEKENRAKAWCFDNGISEDEMVKSWNRAIEKDNHIITNLSENGKQWWWLPPHLLEQLVTRY